MMRTGFTAATVVAMTLALAATSAAQIPDAQSEGKTTKRTEPADRPDAVTMTGCVRQEKDVKGQHPDLAERVGVGEDYLLTGAKVTTSSHDISGIKMPSTFKIAGPAASQVKNHVGHQVQLVGHFSNATSRDLHGPYGKIGPTYGATGSSTTTGSGGSTTGGVTTSSPVHAKDPAERPGAGGNATHVSPNMDLPQVEAESVRMLAATCPAQ